MANGEQHKLGQDSNCFWTDKPFDAEGDFIGDYTGIAAYGGRVYGIWAEEVAPNATKKRHGRRVGPASLRHTVVRVGVADFSKQ